MDKIDPVIAAVDRAKAEHPELFVGSFGDATAERQIGDSVAEDLERAGLLSLPVTIVILVVAFGALVAAGHPAAARALGSHRRRWGCSRSPAMSGRSTTT